MKILTTAALSLAALSLSACATYAPHAVDEKPQKLSKVLSGDLLLAGIDADKISVDGVTAPRLSSLDPVCQTFNTNAAKFAEVVVSQANVLPKPPGGGFGTNLLKTVAFGTLAGAASGGVGSLGIGSSFLELALAGAANQVVFQGSNAAYEAVTSKMGKKDVELGGVAGAAVALSPYQKVQAAAAQIGCPAPGLTTLGLDALPAAGAAAAGTTAGDHTHTATTHSHTSSDGTTFTHTH
jgi:hypothetical protein